MFTWGNFKAYLKSFFKKRRSPRFQLFAPKKPHNTEQNEEDHDPALENKRTRNKTKKKNRLDKRKKQARSRPQAHLVSDYFQKNFKFCANFLWFRKRIF